MNLVPKSEFDFLVKIIKQLLLVIAFLISIILLILFLIIFKPDIKHWFSKSENELRLKSEISAAKLRLAREKANDSSHLFWTAPDLSSAILDRSKKAQLEYGRELITHTSKYLGPKGSVLQISKGMNCQNCHLDAGTKIFGNNYSAVWSTYPKYRARSGQKEDIYKRINDCIERSLNGKALPLDNREINAMKAYIEFLGQNIPKGTKPKGSGISDLAFLDRPANPDLGKVIYSTKCQSCHLTNGEGVLAENKLEYTYPPLWGPNSYNQGAGLFRLSRLAGYIKYNMPNGSTYFEPQLSDEEAWDLAAYINSQPRPKKDLSQDWPKIEEKPIDHPFGPFSDTFSEFQHKFGPFKPIQTAKKAKSKK